MGPNPCNFPAAASFLVSVTSHELLGVRPVVPSLKPTFSSCPIRLVTVIRVVAFRGRPYSASSESDRVAHPARFGACPLSESIPSQGVPFSLRPSRPVKCVPTPHRPRRTYDRAPATGRSVCPSCYSCFQPSG